MTDPAATTGVLPLVLRRLRGQPAALAVLGPSAAAPVHAYLFVGPPGSGKRDAAMLFAAALVCPRGGCGECAACHDALAGRHPDVVVVEREGAAITVDEARGVAALAQRTPRHGPRQVIVLDDFQLVDEAAPALLKTLEEPPETTAFLVLADFVPASLATIASRCVRVDFRPFETSLLAELLEEEGADPESAAAAAAGAGGRLDRARLLAHDPGFAARQERWRSLPEQLDGTGAMVASLVTEVLEMTDELVEVLKARQAAELEAAREAAERAGERSLPGRQGIEDRHRREQRRVRSDELRAGLATLAAVYRHRVRPGLPARELATLLECCREIDEATAALIRNPNETLLLQALLLGLGRAGGS